MDFSDVKFPIPQPSTFVDLSPSVHWAQLHQTVKLSEYPLRRIYDFELLYVQEGHITAYLGEEEYALSTGELLFIGAGVSHRLAIGSNRALFLGIHFDFFDEFDIVADQDIIVKHPDADQAEFCREAVISGQERYSTHPIFVPSPEIVRSMERVIGEFESGKPGYEAVCKGMMIDILIQLLRSRTMESFRIASARERLQPVIDWIEGHYSQDCSNQTLAKLMNLHEDYLGKQFKNVFNISLNKFVQSIRHREAKRLLRQSDRTVEQIGQTVGYDDIHYFSRTFRRWEGMSPREYRRMGQFY
ncbi:helix-turn-helix transcriptional regulator [Cohnella endophytica]|uniref:helix-turn-helix transcriptional regulator n=1 Tax=Cohnella endophytica TaxID=2419778 RepID=UPI0011C399CB|nr:AraC family transcriptional regulator [Cohnella endophytica]